MQDRFPNQEVSDLFNPSSTTVRVVFIDQCDLIATYLSYLAVPWVVLGANALSAPLAFESNTETCILVSYYEPDGTNDC